MHKVIRPIVALTFSLICRNSLLHAEVIVQFGVGQTGSGFGAGIGQSITTPSGGPWENITFNFYDSGTGAAQAQGNVYLLSSAYVARPKR